ncbi:MAG: GxxExxY protein [Opitutaceae bacterium]
MLLYEKETYSVIGACLDVYAHAGCGFLEAVYQECLKIELESRGIPFVPQPTLSVAYKGRPLQHKYQPDLICYEKVILELKSASQLAPEHRAQLQNYLRLSHHRVGLLVNFGHYPGLQFDRIVI